MSLHSSSTGASVEVGKTIHVDEEEAWQRGTLTAWDPPETMMNAGEQTEEEQLEDLGGDQTMGVRKDGKRQWQGGGERSEQTRKQTGCHSHQETPTMKRVGGTILLPKLVKYDHLTHQTGEVMS